MLASSDDHPPYEDDSVEYGLHNFQHGLDNFQNNFQHEPQHHQESHSEHHHESHSSEHKQPEHPKYAQEVTHYEEVDHKYANYDSQHHGYDSQHYDTKPPTDDDNWRRRIATRRVRTVRRTKRGAVWGRSEYHPTIVSHEDKWVAGVSRIYFTYFIDKQ